jgi:hypothetical protein
MTVDGQPIKNKRQAPDRELGGRGSFGASVAGHHAQAGVAEEARTRGFAAPAFAGCAFVDGMVQMIALLYPAVQAPSREYLMAGHVRAGSSRNPRVVSLCMQARRSPAAAPVASRRDSALAASRPRKPSYLGSKSRAGSSNGTPRSTGMIGWNWGVQASQEGLPQDWYIGGKLGL